MRCDLGNELIDAGDDLADSEVHGERGERGVIRGEAICVGGAFEEVTFDRLAKGSSSSKNEGEARDAASSKGGWYMSSEWERARAGVDGVGGTLEGGECKKEGMSIDCKERRFLAIGVTSEGTTLVIDWLYMCA